MGAQLRVYRRRIRSVQSTKKITKAMELIAASRIVKAQARMNGGQPVRRGAHPRPGRARAGHDAQAPDAHRRREPAAGRHPAGHQRPRAGRRVQRQRDQARQRARRAELEGDGREVVRYVIGRKGVGVLQLPAHRAGRVVDRVLRAAELRRRPRGRPRRSGSRCAATSRGRGRRQPGIDELYVVYTQFENIGRADARPRRSSPPVKAACRAAAQDADEGDEDGEQSATSEPGALRVRAGAGRG